MRKLIILCALAMAFVLAVIAQTETPASCPSISVTGPAGITQPGDSMEFKAITPLNNTDRLTFQWTISAGTIERGQGTQEIRVRAPRDLNNSIAITVTASVEISGLPKDCSRTAFEYAAVSSGFHPALIDEFGKLPANDIRGRLDAFLQEVTNNKKQVGFIALYFQRTKGEARLKQRLDLIVRHINSASSLFKGW